MNRRALLANLSAAAAATALSSCRSRAGNGGQAVSVAALDRVANTPVLLTHDLPSPLIIESVRLLEKDGEHFVHVSTADGAEGVSVTNERARLVRPIFNDRVAPFFVGRDARNLESDLWELYRYRSNYKWQGLAFWSAQAYAEFAILDLLGRASGKPISDLFGPPLRTEVPYYIASGARDTTPDEEVETLQRLVEETGARAVKYKVGGRMSRNADGLPNRSRDLIPLSRRVLGDDIAIHVDANSSYDVEPAIAIGRQLEEINAVFFEEPCPFDHLEDTKRVADALAIPVAGGEQEYSQRRFRWMLENRGVDIIQPDIQYYGGLIRSIRVARMAELAGVPTTVHIGGGFGFVYMLHFAAAVPDIGQYQEYKLGFDRYRSWFDPPLRVANGNFIPPRAPGVGLADPAMLLRGAREV